MHQNCLHKTQEFATREVTYDIDICKQLISELIVVTGFSKKQVAAIILAKASSNSPAAVNDMILQEIVSLLKAEEVVELMVWISIQQMLHRLYTYYKVSGKF